MVRSFGVSAEMSMPTSAIASAAAGLTEVPGFEPAERTSTRSPARWASQAAKLHADKGYDYNHLRKWLRERRIRHRTARKGIEFFHAAQPTPLGPRENGLLAGRLPTPAPPLRAWASSAQPQPSSSTADSSTGTTSQARHDELGKRPVSAE